MVFFQHLWYTFIFLCLCPAHIYGPGRKRGFPLSSISGILPAFWGSSWVCTMKKITSLRSAAPDAYIWAIGFLPTGRQAYRHQTGLRAESVALLGSASDSCRKHLLPTGELLVGWGFPGL